MADLSYDEISKLLKYDAETGKLYWLPRTADMFPQVTAFKGGPEMRAKTWNSRCAGKEALNSPHVYKGYLYGSINGKFYRAHRVAWLLYYGQWPKHQIDHINGDTADNRIENLRDITDADNHKNKRMDARNRSGVMGVRWDGRRCKWVVFIGGNGGRGSAIYLGGFIEKEDAIACRLQAEKDHGYHENHGRL